MGMPQTVKRDALFREGYSYIVKCSGEAIGPYWATIGMAKQNFMGRWMPESPDIYRMFLGEYPWAPSVPINEIGDGWTKGRDSTIPKSVLVSAARYVWEGSGYDCSLEDTISIQLPCPWLIDQIGLNWGGKEGYFLDSEGKLVVYDPSVDEKGPSVLLANRRLLERFLERSGYRLVWTVLGEKNILGPGINRGEWKGRLEIAGAIRMENGHFEVKLNPIFKAPEGET